MHRRCASRSPRPRSWPIPKWPAGAAGPAEPGRRAGHRRLRDRGTRRWPTSSDSRSTCSRSTGPSSTGWATIRRHRHPTAIINLARSMGCGSWPKGVETRRQLDELRRLGCDGPGYLFARPAPSDRAWELPIPYPPLRGRSRPRAPRQPSLTQRTSTRPPRADRPPLSSLRSRDLVSGAEEVGADAFAGPAVA